MACINNHRCGTCPRPCRSEIQEKEFGKWWSSLTIEEKETVAGESYPGCTAKWNNMSRDERIKSIQDSGYVRRKGNKATALGHDF